METNKTGRGFPLSDEVRAKVVELHKAGMTNAAIAAELCIGTSSVCRIIKASKQEQTVPEEPKDIPADISGEEKEPAPVAAETSSEWECVTSDTLTINNDNISKDFCQGLLDDIDTAIKMLMECVFGGESIYSSEKTAFDIGGAVRKLQDAYNKLEEVIYSGGNNG